MSHGGSALVILGVLLAAPPTDGSEVRHCEFTASVIEVVEPPRPVEPERRFAMTLKIKVSKASAGRYTSCTEYVGTEIQPRILTNSRQTADAVRKGSVVSLTYDHIHGLVPMGAEVGGSWWWLSAVLGP